MRSAACWMGGLSISSLRPSPGNIANDIGTFLAWWSPGQYLVPGAFIWLGTNYGFAIAITTLIATVVGVLGWTELHEALTCLVSSYSCSYSGWLRFVTSQFLSGVYNGGDVVLFAVLPWCFSALQWATQKRPAVC